MSPQKILDADVGDRADERGMLLDKHAAVVRSAPAEIIDERILIEILRRADGKRKVRRYV